MTSIHVPKNYKYYVYLRKSEDYDLCLVLSNFVRGVYKGFEFQSHLLNPDEYRRMCEWSESKRFKIIKDKVKPKLKETILLDKIKFPTIGQRIVLDDRIFCHKAIIQTGPTHISDSQITMFMAEPAKVFRELCFNIYPDEISILDLWAMGITNQEFQPLMT